MGKYQVIESPANGTVGQDCGIFDFADLPARLQAAVADGAAEARLPALSEGDSGSELSDLSVIVRRRRAASRCWG